VPALARDGIAGGRHCGNGEANGGARGADGLFHPNTRALYKAGAASKESKPERKPSSRSRVGAAWNSGSGARKEELGGAGAVVVVAAELAAAGQAAATDWEGAEWECVYYCYYAGE